MTISHRANAGRHSDADRGFDAYPTAPAAVEALLEVERLPHAIWEPACGRGNIAKVLREHGHAVIASDIVPYDFFQPHFTADFLQTKRAPAGTSALVTNPPYRLAQEFVEHGLELVPHVVLLLRLLFLESERRSNILDTGKLARVHVFRNRLPMMHRDSWAGPRASNAMAFAWFVWDRDHHGPTTIDRISVKTTEQAMRAIPSNPWEEEVARVEANQAAERRS